MIVPSPPVPPGPRLAILFLITAVVSTRAVIYMEDLVPPAVEFFAAIPVLVAAPFLWKGARNFTHAFATLLVTVLSLFPILPIRHGGWRLFLAICLIVLITAGRGFGQSQGRAVEPIVWGISGVGLAWALTVVLNLETEAVIFPLWAGCFWGAAGVGDWLSSNGWLRFPRRNVERRSHPNAPPSRLVARVQNFRRRPLIRTAVFAAGAASVLEGLQALLGWERNLSSFGATVMAVASLLLSLRGASRLRSALVTFIPLGLAASSAENTELAFCAALIPTWIWGVLHGQPLRRVIANALGGYLGGAALGLTALLFYDPVSASSLRVGAGLLGHVSVRIFLAAFIAVLLHGSTFAADAFADWFVAKAHGRQPAPLSVTTGLSSGDIGLMRARFLLSGNTVRALALGSLTLAVGTSWSAIKLRSMQDSAPSAAGQARPELVLLDLAITPSTTRGRLQVRTGAERPRELYREQLAVSRKITFRELRVVTGWNLPHPPLDEALPAILNDGWHEIPLIAALEYCDNLSRVEGLEQCYGKQLPWDPRDASCTGYRLPTDGEWLELFDNLNYSSHGSRLDDLHDGQGELVLDYSAETVNAFTRSSASRARFFGQTCGRKLSPELCDIDKERVGFRVVRTIRPHDNPHEQE